MKITLRKIISGLSFTTALFVFQACYGTPQDNGKDIFIEGYVKSKTSQTPIKNIKIIIAGTPQYIHSNENGYFALYTEHTEKININFQDIDSIENGRYKQFDTILKPNSSNKIFLNISLENN